MAKPLQRSYRNENGEVTTLVFDIPLTYTGNLPLPSNKVIQKGDLYMDCVSDFSKVYRISRVDENEFSYEFSTQTFDDSTGIFFRKMPLLERIAGTVFKTDAVSKMIRR